MLSITDTTNKLSTELISENFSTPIELHIWQLFQKFKTLSDFTPLACSKVICLHLLNKINFSFDVAYELSIRNPHYMPVNEREKFLTFPVQIL